MTGLDIAAIRARFAKVEAIAREESPSEYRLVAVHALAVRCLEHEAAMHKVTGERDDALQMLADLQGGTP